MSQATHVLIVDAPYYEEIARHLLEGTVATLQAAGATHERIEVPGAFEIPAAIKFAAAAKKDGRARFDAFVALGCIVRGETTHYDYVCGESARGLMDLTLDPGLPIGYGILTVENQAQALERARVDRKNKGRDAAEAALRMLELKRAFAQGGV